MVYRRRIPGLVRVLALIFITMIGLNGAAIPARADDTTPTPPVVLFHDDFTARADRWRLIDLSKASISYDPAALRLTAKPANYALWSIPDSDLKPTQFALSVQGTWTTGDDSALFGVVLDYQSDTDMTVVSIARDGTVRASAFYFGVLSDLAPSIKLTLDPSVAVTLHLVLSADHRLTITVNDQTAQNFKLSKFKAGQFGVFAQSGATGGISVAFQNFVVSDLP